MTTQRSFASAARATGAEHSYWEWLDYPEKRGLIASVASHSKLRITEILPPSRDNVLSLFNKYSFRPSDQTVGAKPPEESPQKASTLDDTPVNNPFPILVLPYSRDRDIRTSSALTYVCFVQATMRRDPRNDYFNIPSDKTPICRRCKHSSVKLVLSRWFLPPPPDPCLLDPNRDVIVIPLLFLLRYKCLTCSTLHFAAPAGNDWYWIHVGKWDYSRQCELVSQIALVPFGAGGKPLTPSDKVFTHFAPRVTQMTSGSTPTTITVIDLPHPDARPVKEAMDPDKEWFCNCGRLLRQQSAAGEPTMDEGFFICAPQKSTVSLYRPGFPLLRACCCVCGHRRFLGQSDEGWYWIAEEIWGHRYYVV